MSVTVAGEGGHGAVVAYVLGPGQSDQLETLSFQIDTDGTAGAHAVRLVLTLPTVGIVGRVDDLNVGGPGQTNFYTYGLGLNASACTLPTGIAVTDALPYTTLQPETTIELIAIDAAGAEIAGDAISNVLMQFAGSAAAAPPAQMLPLTLLPGSLAA